MAWLSHTRWIYFLIIIRPRSLPIALPFSSSSMENITLVTDGAASLGIHSTQKCRACIAMSIRELWLWKARARRATRRALRGTLISSGGALHCVE